MPTPHSSSNPEDPEFREQVIQRLLREQRSVDELAAELNIDPRLVESWKKDYIDRLHTATATRGAVRKASPSVPAAPVVDDLARKRIRPEDSKKRPGNPIVAFPVAGAKPITDEERQKLEETRRLILEEGKITGDAGRDMGMLPAHAYDTETQPPFSTDRGHMPPVSKHAISNDARDRFAANWKNLGPGLEPQQPIPPAMDYMPSERVASRLYHVPVIGWIMRGCSFQSAPLALALLLAIVAGTSWFLLAKHRETLEREPQVTAEATPISFRPVSRQEREAAETAIRTFFDARSVLEMEPLIRHPDIIRPLAFRYYNGASVSPQPVFAFAESSRRAFLDRPFTLHEVRFNPLSSTREILVEHTDEGPKIDWEIAVAYQPMPWPLFQRTMPRKPVYFRLQIQHSTLYLDPFEDPSLYRSFRITHPKEVRIFNGFVPVGSPVEAELTALLPEKDSTARVIAGLRYPDESTPRQSDLVQITELLNDSWIVDYTRFERHFDLPEAGVASPPASEPVVAAPRPVEVEEATPDATDPPATDVLEVPEEPQG